ncbi:MAG TPA: YlaI family protein [Pseudogracilibacillus sp.]|nr:YlaI family protein [Pseudogracilibacillus sp.]
MKVQCVICDTIHEFDDDCFEAKRLKNRWIRTYLCDECDERIKKNTLKRHESGKFHLYRDQKKPFFEPKNIKKTDD